jgi:hypothetical protein
MRSVDDRPRRTTVASYDRYADAQRAVDYLSDRDFPVERSAIVGHGLQYVEQVAGRMTVGRAALMGAAQGASLGALFGLLVWAIFSTDPNPSLLLLLVYGIVVGAIAGALLGAIAQWATRGERDFASVPSLQAERYDVEVDEELAERASELLRTFETARA